MRRRSVLAAAGAGAAALLVGGTRAEAATLTSAFTPEFNESTHTTTTEEADELHQH